jgi:hypothetical protein
VQHEAKASHYIFKQPQYEEDRIFHTCEPVPEIPHLIGDGDVGAWQSQRIPLRLLCRSAPRKDKREGRRVIFSSTVWSEERVVLKFLHDPRAIAEWNKRMSSGEKTSPEYEEIIERMAISTYLVPFLALLTIS